MQKPVKYLKFDDDFYTLLITILSKNYSREEIKLKLMNMDYKKPVNDNVFEVEGFITHTVPLNALYITYDEANEPTIASLKIGFYLKIRPRFIWEKIAKVRRNQIFSKQLENIINKNFEKHDHVNGKSYWDDGAVVLKKRILPKVDKDWLYIQVDFIRKSIFPNNKYFIDWVKN